MRYLFFYTCIQFKDLSLVSGFRGLSCFLVKLCGFTAQSGNVHSFGQKMMANTKFCVVLWVEMSDYRL